MPLHPLRFLGYLAQVTVDEILVLPLQRFVGQLNVSQGQGDDTS